jgi:hypothetical protein
MSKGCTKKKNCKASMHYSTCPAYRPSRNDDATYNRSNLTIEQAMDLGFWDMVPSERGDSMG